MTCRTCAKDIPDGSRFCLACGADLNGAVAVVTQTVAAPAPTPRPTPTPTPARSFSHASLASSSSSLVEGRFTPGVLLAGRYRIVALLGRGGMGEVYRAHDLTLGQEVALKFLPEAATRNSSALTRFYNEVRVARQVTHPNVCRVYDLGEVDGQPYLSMEYVDGEDLGSLLRRIGRLPADKAVEIARQLCAGLAAAHARGVLHRDLKPANVMLNGRGQVVITDFGLAAIASEIPAEEVRNGTPAYMAPEQLAGRDVTVQSDIYSLGLVLYEVFTGKRAFEASTLAELVRLHSETTPVSPSTLVRELDPGVESAILRCLDPEPANRPPSALAVAARLPGGDPLAAALAAGETPSPQLVAASGETAALPWKIAIPSLAAALAGLALFAFLAASSSFVEDAQLTKPPDVLVDKARELIQGFGYTARGGDSAWAFDFDLDFLNWVQKADKPFPHWEEIARSRPAGLKFWYRQSTEPMVTLDVHSQLLIPGVIQEDDPHPYMSGMTLIRLDPQGRLTYLEALPPEREDPPPPSAAPDWKALFTAAGLDITKFQPATPVWASLAASDIRQAWNGQWPGFGNRPLHVEAASWHGRPVFFSLIGPWTHPARMPSQDTGGAGELVQKILIGVIVFLPVLAAIFLARWNYVHGKGDRRGAMRLAVLIFTLHMALWTLQAHISSLGNFVFLLIIATGMALFLAGTVWLLYLALEPYVRRYWPQALISWTRVLAGRWRDPLVGRDVLYGAVLGVIFCVLYGVRYHLEARFGGSPGFGSLEYLANARIAAGAWFEHIPDSIASTLLLFLLLFLFRVVLRKSWLAAAAFVLLFALFKSVSSDYPAIEWPMQTVLYVVLAVGALRFGLVALAVALYTADVALNIPITLNTSAWYFNDSTIALATIAALAIWGFYTARGVRTQASLTS
ncbi:MAG TPA: serine/threonine-protein kinase [Bryobacteraceae bacterium]|nr:serine/threonine-protein kinase [Bryobacteraceae bacterium]